MVDIQNTSNFSLYIIIYNNAEMSILIHYIFIFLCICDYFPNQKWNQLDERKGIFPKSSTIRYQLATLYATNLLTLFFKLAEAMDASVN